MVLHIKAAIVQDIKREPPLQEQARMELIIQTVTKPGMQREFPAWIPPKIIQRDIIQDMLRDTVQVKQRMGAMEILPH